MKFQTHRGHEPTFNLTPLIDILFIVLIFLVLTTTFRDAATFQVNLPPATTGERESRERPGLVTITVAEDGSVELDGSSVSIESLRAQLTAFEVSDRTVVRLRADAGARHGVIVQIMDIVRGTGITELSIETRPDPNGAR